MVSTCGTGPRTDGGDAPVPAPASGEDFGTLLERATWIGEDGVALVRLGRIEWANPSLHSICSVPPGSLIGAPIDGLDVRQLSDTGDDVGDPVSLGDDLDRLRPRRLQLRRADGSATAVSVMVDRIQAVPDGFWVLRMREIAVHIRTDEALRSSEARFRALADHAPIGVFLSDVGVRLAFVNARFAQVWGRPAEELVGDRWLEPILTSDREAVLAAIGEVLGGTEAEVTMSVIRPDGDVRTLDCRMVPVDGADKQATFVGSVEDVTDARAREAELEWQARHDALTGLPNRVELWDQISGRLDRNDEPVAVLFFDLDDFKLVNDSLGHAAGDVLLGIVACRLRDAVRVDDIVARFGGDEFIVFCPEVRNEREAKEVADRLLAGLREPIDLGRRQVRISASVGVVVSRAGMSDPESLIRDADVAMYQAKTAGKARAAIFATSARQVIEQRLDIVSDLRRALVEDEVEVHYQPIVDTRSLRIVGVEALLRYRHVGLGPIPANAVIDVAEASGCIDDLGAYVLEKACTDLAEWRRRARGWRPGYVSVNLAASQLEGAGFVDLVHDALERNHLEPGDLCLELTESQLMTDVERSAGVLGHLAESGIRVAIDDFGTGYSSLAYLKRFPVSLVKIDRSFVVDPEEGFTAAIIEAVVSVTRAVDGQVVAEGIETLDQLDRVSGLGCDLVQGYLLGRPVPLDELPVSSGQCPPSAPTLTPENRCEKGAVAGPFSQGNSGSEQGGVA